MQHFYLHTPSRLLYSFKIAIKLYFHFNYHASKKEKRTTTADSFATASRSFFSGHYFCFGGYSSGDDCTETIAYLENTLNPFAQENGFPTVISAVDMVRYNGA